MLEKKWEKNELKRGQRNELNTSRYQAARRERKTPTNPLGRHTVKRRTHALFHNTPTIIQEITFFNIAARRLWLCVYEGYRIARFFAVLPLTCKNRTHIFSLLLPVKKIVYSNWKKSKNKWIIIKCQFFERFLQAWSFFCVVPR